MSASMILPNDERTLQCDALLFDLDGVLVDSAACSERLLREWALHHALDPARVCAVAHGCRTVETVQHVAPHLDAAAEAEVLTAREAITTEGVFEVVGARELLGRLPPNRWGIVTSGARSVATLRLRSAGLTEPHTLICAGDVIRGKPDPEGYVAAAARLKVAPDRCVVVEDAPAGLEAAHAAGMRSIGVVGTSGVAALARATFTISRLAALHVVNGHGDGALTILLAPA